MSVIDPAPLVDVCISLGDVGGDGFELTECVDPRGIRSFWLFAQGCESGGRGHEIPEHEWLGEIPARMQWAINMPRCGALGTTGIRCRRRVRALGQRCHAHRENCDQKDGER